MRRAGAGGVLVFLALAACASDEAEDPARPDDPPPDTNPSEAGTAPDGAPCEGCQLFPDACVEGALCPTSVTLAPRQVLLSVAARSESDVWVAGALGTVFHYDGATWNSEAMPRKETFGAVLLRGPNETWLGSSLASSYALAPDLQGDGGPPGWASVGMAGAHRAIRALWSKGETSWIWAGLDEIGDDTLVSLVRLRRSDASLEVQSLLNVAGGGATNGIDGLSASEVWAVGDRGVAYRITAADSETPLVEPINTRTNQSLEDVSVAPNGEAWAVGTLGTVRLYRGPDLGWQRVEVPTIVHLRGVLAVGADDVWVVGDDATVLHFDGARWSPVPVAGLDGLRPSLRAVASPSDGHIIVIGDRVLLELRSRKGG